MTHCTLHRLWDLRSPPAAVAAVEGCFADEAVTSVKWHPFDSERLFASAGTQVLELDRRKLDEPCHCHLVTEEEINCVDVHEGGQHLAVADDTGAVHIVDLIGSARPQQLSKRHANICSAVAFRPQSPLHLASAGLDCAVITWNWAARRVQRKFDLIAAEAAAPTASTDTSSQLLNPPLAHCLAFSPDGAHLAAGLGDASIAVWDYQRKRQVSRNVAHRAAVCCLHWAAALDSDVVVSAGADRRLLVWSHTRGLLREGGVPLSVVELRHKPNAVCSAAAPQDCILVADTSSGIAVLQRRG